MWSRTLPRAKQLEKATAVWSFDIPETGKLKLTRLDDKTHGWRFYRYADGTAVVSHGSYLSSDVALQNAAHVLKLDSKAILKSWHKTLDSHSRNV